MIPSQTPRSIRHVARRLLAKPPVYPTPSHGCHPDLTSADPVRCDSEDRELKLPGAGSGEGGGGGGGGGVGGGGGGEGGVGWHAIEPRETSGGCLCHG